MNTLRLTELDYLADAHHFRCLWLTTRHSEHLGAYRACLRLARRVNSMVTGRAV